MLTTDDALCTYELRIELTQLSEGPPIHVALYATDAQGQWMLVDDWTPEHSRDREATVSELVDQVSTWLYFGGKALAG